MVVINQITNFRFGNSFFLGTIDDLNTISNTAPGGTASGGKALVLDANRNITNINSLTCVSITGTILTPLQPNITTIGSLTSLTVTGNTNLIGGFQINGTTINATPTQLNYLSSITPGIATASKAIVLDASSNIATIGNLSTSTITMGGINKTANSWLTTGIQLNSLVATYTINNAVASSTVASAVIRSIGGTSSIAATNTNVTITNAASLYIAGPPLAGTNVTITNNYALWIGSGSSLFGSNIASTSTTTGTLIITGGIGVSGSIYATSLSGTLLTVAQPNITSVGTLSNLTISGNLIVGGNTFSGTLIGYLTSITPGTASASKALVLDASSNIATINTLTVNKININTYFNFGGTNVSTASWLTTGVQLSASSSIYTNNSTPTSTTVATAVLNSFAQSTIAASNLAVTTTNAANVYIAGPAIAGTNMTLTNNYSLWIASGNSLFNGNLTVSGTIGGTLTTAAQPNITSVGTLINLTIGGTLAMGSNNITSTGTIGGTLTTAVQTAITSVGTLTGLTMGGTLVMGSNNITGTGTIGGTLTTAAQTAITSVGTLTSLTMGGTLAMGTNNITGTGTIGGTLTTATQTNITSVGTLTGLTVSGIITNTNTTQSSSISTGGLILSGGLAIAKNMYIGGTPISSTAWGLNGIQRIALATTFTDTSSVGTTTSAVINGFAQPTIAASSVTTFTNSATIYIANAPVAGTNVTLTNPYALWVGNGNVLFAGNLTVSGTIGGTLITSTQPNITSVGTLNSLTIASNNNISVSGTGTLVGASNITTSTSLTTPLITAPGVLTISPFTSTSITGNVDVGGNLLVNGNLVVNGTTTTINSTNVLVDDNTIILNSGPNSSGYDSGFLTQRYQINNAIGSGDVVSDTAKESYTIVSATTTTVTLPSGANTTVNYYNGWWIKITSGVGINQVRQVTAYSGATRIITLNNAFDTSKTPSTDNISLYNKMYSGIVWESTNKQFISAYTTQDVTGSLTFIDYTNMQVNNLIANQITGTIATISQPLITSIGTLTELTMGGTLAMGTNNITGTGTIGGTLTTAAQTNITSLGTLNGLTMGGVLAMGTNNITGTGTIGGTLTTAAQTNITSVGTLTGLTVNGVITNTNTTHSTSSSTGCLVLSGGLAIAKNIRIGGTPISSSAWGLIGIQRIALATTFTDTSSIGTIASTVINGIAQSTIAASSVTTFTNSSTLFIAGSPIAGTNVTLTNTYALWVGSGNVLFAGNLTVSGTIGGVLTTAAQTNITSVGTLTGLTLAGTLTMGSNNITGTGTIGGTLTTAAQTNITSVGTLTGLTMGGTLAMGSNNITSTGTIGGTLTTAVQTNITSVGTLTGLTIAGTLIMGANNITGTGTIGGTLTTAAQTNITSVGTLTGLTMGGTLSMGTNNITGTGTIGGTLTTAAQTNITSVGTLTGLTMGGNLVMGTNNISGTGTIGGTLTTAMQTNITSVGTLTGLMMGGTLVMGTNNITGTGTIGGTLTTSAQPNITSVGSLTNLTVVGAIVGVLSTSAQSNITSLGVLTGLTMGGTLSMGTNNITGTGTIGGTLTTAAQTNITSVGTLTGLTMGGTLSMGTNNITGTGTIGGTLTTAAQTNITSVGTLTGLTMGGVLAMGSNNITSTGTIGGLLTTAAQTNITSVGTLTNLSISGTLTLAGTALTATAAQINVLSGITPGVATASKVLVLDASSDIATINTLTVNNLNITTGFNFGGTNLTMASWLTNGVQLSTLTATYTNNSTASLTTIPTAVLNSFAQSTIAATSLLVTTTNAANVYIAGPPIAGANMTLTNLYSLWVASGNVLFAGNLTVSGTFSGTLITAAQTNITSVGTLTSLTMGGTLAMGVNNITGTGTIGGTLTTAVQTNITSVGTLTSLSISGTLTLAGTALTATATQINVLTSVTPGTAAASKALVLDASSNIATINTLTVNNLINRNSIDIGGTNSSVTSWLTTGVQLSALPTTYTNNSTPTLSTVATAVLNSFAQSTIAASNLAVTTTNAANVYIAGPPIAGTNMTLTNMYALWIASGNSLFAGNLTVSGTISGIINTSDQPNITSLGILTDLIMGGTLSMGVNNITGTGTIGGTLTTAAQTNITSVGTLSSLLVSGTIGVNKTTPTTQVEINSTTGNCLRLTYNTASGTATKFTDFKVSSTGNLFIDPSGPTVQFGNTSNTVMPIEIGTVTYTIPTSFGWLKTNGTIGSSASGTSTTYSLRANGRIICNTEIDVISDIRVKTDIKFLDNDFCKNFITNTNPVSYKFTHNGEDKTHYGYIAQDIIRAGYDQLVSTVPNDQLEELIEADGFTSPAGKQLTLCYDEMIPILAKNISILYEENKQLKSQIAEILQLLKEK